MSNRLICRSAKRLRTFVIVLMVGMAAVMAMAWLGLAAGPVHVELRQHSTAVDPKLAGVVLTLLLEIALFELTRMVGLIASGDYYSMPVIRHFRAFALWLLILAAVGVAGPLTAAAISGVNSTDHRLAFPLSLNDLITLGVALLLFLLAQLLERAREIEQEYSEIV